MSSIEFKKTYLPLFEKYGHGLFDLYPSGFAVQKDEILQNALFDIAPLKGADFNECMDACESFFAIINKCWMDEYKEQFDVMIKILKNKDTKDV